MNAQNAIVEAIESSPLNRGLRGAEWLAREGNIPVILGDDIALFDDEGEGTYQVHFLFKSRGKAAVVSAREAFRHMFEQHKAELIFGMTPIFLRAANMVARWAGGKFVGQRPTKHGDCNLFVLSRDMWSPQ